ncbi:MAG: 6-hydroxymethylpterin diphosphokinase MptE-like protein [Gallionellaceae bacterium]|jgi:hypothetical protein
MLLHDNEIRIRHPAATMDLILGVQLQAETDREYAEAQFNENIEFDCEWLKESQVNSSPAIVCGAAPSLLEGIELIKDKQKLGAVIFACNRAAQVLCENGIVVDYQVVLDPAKITESEFCDSAKTHLLSSFCYPPLFKRSNNPILWHLLTDFVVNRVEHLNRDFSYIGGGVTVANSTLCLAHTLGHREIEVFGMDSSYETSFYATGETLESIGSVQLLANIQHGGKNYKTTFDMKQQVVVFLKLEEELKKLGTKIRVHGTGLLPDVFNNQGETK